MTESEGRIFTTTGTPRAKAPVEIRITGLGMNPGAPVIRLPRRKNVSQRQQMAQQDLLDIASAARSTAEMRGYLLGRRVPLTEKYRKDGFQSWNQVPDASLRSLKRRVLSGNFPPF